MTVYCFEDLVIWKLARELVKDIYFVTANINDYGYNSQIQRASISIMNNIAEGFDRSKNTKDNKQLLSFLNIAYGSCGEVKSMLYTAEDLSYLTPEKSQQLRNQCSTLNQKTEAFIKTIRKKDN